MENHFGSHEEHPGLDAQQQARQFEQRLHAQETFYMDLTTIDEVYEYYRMMDQPDKAQTLLDFATAQYPYNADLYYKKSCLAFEHGEFDIALDHIRRALNISPSDSQCLMHLARVQAAREQFDEAMETLTDLLEITDHRAEVYYQLGQLCQGEEKYSDAIRYYTQALEADVMFEDALFEIVFCFEEMARLHDGIEYCTRYIDNHPYSSTAWYNLGMLQHKVGQFEKAIPSFDYAILIQEDFISAYYGKASSLMELKKYDEAVQVLLQSLHHDRNDIATLLSLGECYENLGEFARARFYYVKCSELFPHLADAWYGIGSSYESESRYLEAIHYYRKAIDLNKDYFDAWLGLADSEYYLGNEVSAFEALRTAIQLFPEDLEMWRSWGERLAEDRDPESAMTLLEEGIRQNPTAAELLYQYAAYALRAGKQREAFGYLENALVMDYTRHPLLFAFCPKAAEYAPVQAVIDQYRPAQS